MATKDVNKYIMIPKYPCPFCGNESKPDQDPTKKICTNNAKGGPRHTWTPSE